MTEKSRQPSPSLVEQPVVMRLLLAAALMTCACTGGGDDNNPDVGVPDSGKGPDGCGLDNQPRDGGVNLGPCNPADGTRCEVSSGRYCVWDYETDEGACRCLGDAPKNAGESCSLDAKDCAAGLACISINGMATCYQVCTQQNPMECDRLNTPDVTFACFPIRTATGQTTMYGLCDGLGRPCDPLIDQCDATETCVLVSTRSAVCLPSGPVPLGGDCSVDECAKGGLCVPLVDQNGNPLGTKCYEPCDLGTPACGAGSCTDVGLDGFGICL